MQSNIRRTFVSLAALGAISVAGVAIAQQGTARGNSAQATSAQSEARTPKVMIIAFHADWCGGCKVLGPKLMENVLPAVKDDPSLFVKLDLTDPNSAQAEYMLSVLGLGNLWEEYAGKTGFALVVDVASKKVVGKLGYTEEPAALTATVKKALRS